MRNSEQISCRVGVETDEVPSPLSGLPEPHGPSLRSGHLPRLRRERGETVPLVNEVGLVVGRTV